MRIILNKDTPGGYITVVYDLTILLLHLYNTYLHILRYTLHYYRNLLVYMYFTLSLSLGIT